jgi:hypothetical protein
MQLTLTASRDDLREAATKTLGDAAEKAQDLAGQAAEKAHDVAGDVVAKGRKRYGKRAARKLEKAARKLPVDTPIDKRRRRRTRRRSAGSTVLMIVVAGGFVAAYLAWRRRQAGEAFDGAAPDAFGAAVEEAGNGQGSPVQSTVT